MKDLLDSDGESVNNQPDDTLKINEEYKRNYDERKRKEALSRAKDLLKNNKEEENNDNSFSESDSSDEDEDSEAELLDFKTQNKILETLEKIKKKDPSIYDNSHIIFPDSSESDSDSESKACNSDDLKSSKPMTFKDYERKILLNSKEDEEDNELVKKGISKKLGYDKEQDELKKAFLKAAEGIEDSGDEFSETLIKKDKSKEELEEEEKSFKSFLTRNIEEGGDPIESLNRYWGPEEELDENEKFLRSYILEQKWKDNNSQTRINDVSKDYTIQTEIDEEEDEKHLEMSNEFESVYNFRYEEPGACQQIMGYSRNISSLRRPDDRRKLKRKEKKERKAEEKLRMEEELKFLKSIKRKEIIEKVKKIQEISGIKGISDEKLDLEGDFDPDKHDKYMEELFDDEYNDKKEDLSLCEILENNEELDEDNDGNIKSKKQAKINEKESSIKENQLDNESETVPSIYDDNEEWWQCDGCLKEILPSKKKFDCTVCENFTLCKSCCRNTDHEHPLKKSRVPESNNKYKQSNGFDKDVDVDGKIDSNRLNLSYGDDEKINSLLDEYYGLHFEDVLDNGKIPVRFKYAKVEKDDYGLSVEDILSMDDKELNQHISLKKLAPYRFDKKRKHSPPARTLKDSKSSNKMNKHHKSNKLRKNYSNDKNSANPVHINRHRLESYY